MYTKEIILSSFFNKNNIDPKSTAKAKYRDSPSITFYDLFNAIYDYDGNGILISKFLNISKTTYYNTLNKLFPKAKLQGTSSWKSFIFYNSDYKFCSCCKIARRLPLK